MKNLTILALLILGAAGCRKQKVEAGPDYDGARQRSERAHDALDEQAK